MEAFIMIIRYYNCSDDKLQLNKTLEFVDAANCNVYGICNMETLTFISETKPKGNYAAFDNRCYFINSYSYANGKWLIHCSLDYLYTNRNEILNMEILVARSEDKTSDIPDNNIVMRTNKYVKSQSFGTDIIANSTVNYLVGVI